MLLVYAAPCPRSFRSPPANRPVTLGRWSITRTGGTINLTGTYNLAGGTLQAICSRKKPLQLFKRLLK